MPKAKAGIAAIAKQAPAACPHPRIQRRSGSVQPWRTLGKAASAASGVQGKPSTRTDASKFWTVAMRCWSGIGRIGPTIAVNQAR